MTDAPPPADSREYDIVLFGATGFVGRIIAARFAATAPPGVRIALAGRSADRLEVVRADLGPGAAQFPIVVADADDPASLDRLARSARVVATTVGPYARSGLPLVRACAEAGTDYVDLTGEVLFHRASIDAYDTVARATGARIVHSCGFDSIPSDLGVHVLYGTAAADGHTELIGTTLVVTSIRGGLSGGTLASLRLQSETVAASDAAREIVDRPYSLSPDPSLEPDLGPQRDLAIVDGRTIAPGVSGWKMPFFMGPYNTRVVRRTNALRGHAYGRRFHYREVMSVGSGPLNIPFLSLPVAGAGTVALGSIVAGMRVRPVRAVFDRFLPNPGDGPSEEQRAAGHFRMEIHASTGNGDRYLARFAARADPGYDATAVMFAESALALLDERTDAPGGVLTPAVALGDVLVERLRDAGFEISARRTQ